MTNIGTNRVIIQSDASGALLSHGHNLLGSTNGMSGLLRSDLYGVPPELGSLQDNGGPTLTHALFSSSLAVNGAETAGAPRTETIAALQQAFASLGYEVCAGEELETGFAKIALFADGEGFPRHAARQLPSGRWTSKLGELEDIEHALNDLAGTEYGSVVRIMKRPAAA